MKTKILFGLAAALAPAFLLVSQYKSTINRPSDLRDAPADVQLQELLPENQAGSRVVSPIPAAQPQDPGAALKPADDKAAEDQKKFLNDVLPVIRRESRENDVQYRNRGALVVEDAIRKIARVSGKVICTEDIDFLRRGYLRLEWEYGGWKYATLARVLAGRPVTVHNITMTPLNGDKAKMPKTKEEFIRLVSELTFLRVEEVREGVDNGRPDFLAKLDDKCGEAALDSSFVSTDYGPIDACGSIMITWPNSARLKYFVNVP